MSFSHFIFFLLMSFSQKRLPKEFQWGLSDIKSHQVSRTSLNILANFNNSVVRMNSIGPPILKSSYLLSKAFWDYSLRTNYICHIHHLHVPKHSFFSCSVRALVFLLGFFLFSLNDKLSFFFFFGLSFSVVLWPRFGDLFISQNSVHCTILVITFPT